MRTDWLDYDINNNNNNNNKKMKMKLPKKKLNEIISGVAKE